MKRSSRGRLAVVVVVAVALAALLAAPALAAPATTWTVSPTSASVTYGSSVILNGTLRSGQTAVGGKWVDFQQSTTATGSFADLYKITTAASGYYTGTYSVAVMPLQTTYYRFSWAGDADFAASNSDVVPVSVKPALGKPTCPASVKMNKKFTVKGSVKPGAPTGPAVKIKAYRQKHNGSWTGYKTYKAKVSGTTASVRIKITQTGKFKFKTSTADSASYAAAMSSYSKVLTVKQ